MDHYYTKIILFLHNELLDNCGVNNNPCMLQIRNRPGPVFISHPDPDPDPQTDPFNFDFSLYNIV